MSRNRGGGGNLSGRSEWEQDEVDRERAEGQQIPHRAPGKCKEYKEHRLAKVGTVEIGGVPLNRIECQQPGCNFKTTEPFGLDG